MQEAIAVSHHVAPDVKPPPKRPRRKQEDRIRETREKILKATVRLLVDQGFRGLSLREVAKTAGVSYGALAHHFQSKDDLTVAATAMVYEEVMARTATAAKAPAALRNPVRSFVEDCLRVYFDWPFVAALEILMAARSDKPLLAKMLPVMELHRSTCDRVWLEVFTSSGMTDRQARMILNLSLNIVRGMGVNRVWKHDDAYYDTYLTEWTEVATDLLQRTGGAGRRVRK